jgi:hypothetical protein
VSKPLTSARPATLALAVLFLISLPAITSRLYSSDEVQYFSYLRSPWFDRDLSFENEYRYFYDRGIARSDGFHETFLERATATGRRVNFGTIGCAMLWSPFYAAGHVYAKLTGAPPDGLSRPYIAAVAIGSAFYGFLAVVMSVAAARRFTNDASSVAAGVMIWLGTPLLFYMYVAPPMSHACSAFAVALFVTIWLRARETWSPGGAAALGAGAALMAMVREQDLFVAVGPAVDFLLRLRDPGPVRDSRVRWLVAGLAGVGTFAVAYTPQLVAYISLNGRPGPSELVTRKMYWNAPHAIQVLLSPEHGFFFWTPLALMAVAGLVILALDGAAARPDARRIGACALLMVAVQVYVSGSVDSWTVAGAFGQRRFVALTILLVIGLAAVLDRVPRGAGRAAVVAACVAAVWWNVGMIAAFGAGLMDRQRLELGRNAYDVFVTIPRMAPGLVSRYLFSRESFYKTPPSEAP